MTRSNHRIFVGAVAVSLVLFASACGSSGGSDGTKDEKTTTTKAAAESTTTEAEASADDAQARAESIDLELADFPEGWDSTPAEDPDAESPLNECDPALGDRSVQLARHATDDFSIGTLDGGDGVQVTARTVVFEDEAAAEAAVAPFSDPDVISCIDDTLKSAYTSSGQDVTVEGTLSPEEAPFDVDESTALSATYTVSAADGSSLDVNFGVLVLRQGDVATNLVIQTVDPDFDVTTLPVDKLVTQLKAA